MLVGGGRFAGWRHEWHPTGTGQILHLMTWLATDDVLEYWLSWLGWDLSLTKHN